MDIKQLTDRSPGHVIPYEGVSGGWAFLPTALPPELPWTDELWSLLLDAKESLAELNGIGQTLPSPRLLLQPLQSREAISSSSIEGTVVTPQQLMLYRLDPTEASADDAARADSREVANYSEALAHGCELLESMPLMNRLIREMHRLLMQGVRGRDKTPGEFRRLPVQIGSAGRYVPPPAAEVSALMGTLEKYINAADDDFDPLVRAFLVHYQFEAIHPFLDGNGRVGRALLALMIFHQLGHSQPWLYMSAYYERYRDEYVDHLLQITLRGAWTAWLEFCLRGVAVQARDSVDRCHRLNKLRSEFPTRVTSPSRRTPALIDSLFESPVLTIPSVAKAFGVTYPTAQADVERLVDAKILTVQDDTHPRSFVAEEIIDAAYGELEVG